MLYSRIFPRYEIDKLPNEISSAAWANKNFKIINFSMGGLMIEADQAINEKESVVFDVNILGKEKFKIETEIVWRDDGGEIYPFRYGLHITFSDKNDYLRWKRIALALHLLRKKRKGLKSD